MAISIFIGNLNYDTTEKDILKLLEPFGGIRSLRIITDKYTFKSKGFAHGEVSDIDIASKIIKNLNGHIVNGRAIKVEIFNPNQS